MKIAGIVKSSLIDYPGKVAAVVFTQGCNFRCGFCHNPDLIDPKKPEAISEDDFFEFLKTRVGKLDGVVITGGEPTIQHDLAEFIAKIKELGFLVKLDTNGSNPGLVDQLLSKELIDYLAMDIKGPLKNYGIICGYSNTKIVQDSITQIMNAGMPYEFRTTVLPHYHALADFEKIGKLIGGARKYTVQGFRPEITLEKSLSEERSFTREELARIAKIVREYVETVDVHENL